MFQLGTAMVNAQQPHCLYLDPLRLLKEIGQMTAELCCTDRDSRSQISKMGRGR